MTSSATQVRQKGSLATLGKLLPFLRPYRRQFLLAGIALIIAAGATLTVPYAFKRLIDIGIAAVDAHSAAHIDLYFVALFGVACVLGVATAARFYLVSWLGERVTADLRAAVYRHVVTQSPEFFETTRTGEVLSRLTTDTTLIQTLVITSPPAPRAPHRPTPHSVLPSARWHPPTAAWPPPPQRGRPTAHAAAWSSGRIAD